MGIFGLDFDLGNTISSIFDWATKGDNVLPLVQAGLLTASSLGSRDPVIPYSETEAAFNANQALAREKLAAEMEIAKMQAGAAGAGSGAAIQAAKIAAASAMAQLREKQRADAIMKRIELLYKKPEMLMQGQQLVANALQNRGQATQQGFTNMANVLAGARQ